MIQNTSDDPIKRDQVRLDQVMGSIGCPRPKTIQEDIDNRFTYRPPTQFQSERYIQIRGLAKSLAYLVASLTPENREQSLSITHIQEAVFWANAAIARN